MSIRPTWRTLRALVGWFLLAICGLATHGAGLIWLSAPGQLESSAAETAYPAGELKQSYRRALVQLSSNDSQGALRSLLDLESQAVASTAGAGLEELRKLELRVVKDILPASRELLLPVIILHQRAYLQLREQELEIPASHSRAMVLLLSELYAEHADEVETKRIASDLFASLGGLFRETSAGPTGLKLYARSVKFDRTNEAALLGLAVAYEQRGKYKTALSYLNSCVDAHPENTEAQLRLAINLDRFGRQAEAIRVFEALLARGAPNWQLSLAYQELARVLLARGDLVAAREVVQRGLRRFPRDSTLLIMLAHVDNLRGSDSGGAELAQALKRSAATGSISPRYLYSRDPRQPLRRVRRRLHEHATRNLPALAQALSASRLSEID